MVADVCDAPVTVLKQDEGASFGAALQALYVIESDDSKDLPQLAREHLSRNEEWCCEPKKSSVNFYEESYQKYQKAVSAITPLYQ